MPVRGTRDIINQDAINFNAIREFCNLIAIKNNFNIIEMPIIEKLETFHQNLGDQSDIVSKEMFIFDDKKGSKIALRPEFTASIARMYSQNFTQCSKMNKFFTFGPLFRYNRPQKGRYRQFYQANYETINDIEVLSDVENIMICQKIISTFNDSSDITIEMNYIPSKSGLNKYTEYLSDFFHKNKDLLSEYSLDRYQRNPLRILDSKYKEDISLCEEIEDIKSFLSNEEINNYKQIKSILNSENIKFNCNKNMVRGLDYYNGFVFEFVSNKIGEGQASIAGGGRYNGLINKFLKKPNNNDINSSGFAIGVYRLMMNYEKTCQESNGLCFLIFKDDICEALNLVYKIKNLIHFRCEIRCCKNIKKQITDVVNDNFRYLSIIGSNEIKENKLKIKDLKTSDESELMEINSLISYLNKTEIVK